MTTKMSWVMTCGLIGGLVSGCSTGLPIRDTHPELAKSAGYYVSHGDTLHRDGVLNHVWQHCSAGGWGAPANCQGAVEKVAAAAVPAVVARTEAPVAATPAKRGAALLKVFFETGSAQLDTSEAQKLNAWISNWRSDAAHVEKLSVQGFADSRGNAKANHSLSMRRAGQVLGFLKSRGLSVQGASVAARGGIAGTTAPEAAKEARRVEIYITD